MTVAVTERGVAMDESPTPFEEALNRTGNGLYNYLLASTAALILLAIGVDLFGFSLVVAAACELELSLSQKGILTSVPFIGILLVSYAWGYVSDIKGRRFTLVLSMGTAFVLSCLSCLSPNWIFLAVLKFLSVCFSCASHSATYTLVGESCTQRVRSKYMVMMTCLLLLSSGVGGVLAYPTLKLNFSIALPILNIMFRPWRLLIIVMAIPSGIGGLAIYFFHESPKFLANSGRTDEAIHVLKRIFEINHRGSKEEFCIKSVLLEEESTKKEMSFMRSIYEQSATLFRPPFLWRTVQLYYLIAVVYITNNTFLIWLPHILDMVRQNLESSSATKGNICSLISTDPVTAASLKAFNNTDIFNSTITTTPAECSSGVEDNVVFTLVISQFIFTVLNFFISYLPNYRKMVLVTVLCLSSLSGVCLNLMPEPIPSVFFFVTFGCTCLGMGILASYFVDMYPTSYRGMVACLSIMVGRSSAFVGINIVGNLLFNYCQITFYAWALLVFSAVVVAYFLPPDKVVKSG